MNEQAFLYTTQAVKVKLGYNSKIPVYFSQSATNHISSVMALWLDKRHKPPIFIFKTLLCSKSSLNHFPQLKMVCSLKVARLLSGPK